MEVNIVLGGFTHSIFSSLNPLPSPRLFNYMFCSCIVAPLLLIFVQQPSSEAPTIFISKCSIKTFKSYLSVVSFVFDRTCFLGGYV